MQEAINEEILFNRQVNYFIIEKLWEFINPKKEKESFYKLIGINANSYSNIRTANTYNRTNLERYWNKENSKLRATGLPEDIMLGKRMIEIENISKKDWELYLDSRNSDSKESYERISMMAKHNRNLKKEFGKLKATRQDTRVIAKLFFYFTYGSPADESIPDKEIKDLQLDLQRINVDNIKMCNPQLKEEVHQLLIKCCEQFDIIIKYEKL